MMPSSYSSTDSGPNGSHAHRMRRLSDEPFALHGASIIMARKNPAAVALGRRGGRARARNLSPAARSEAARRAGEARGRQARLAQNSPTSPPVLPPHSHTNRFEARS